MAVSNYTRATKLGQRRGDKQLSHTVRNKRLCEILRGHDERERSVNPGVFCGFVDLVPSLSGALKELLEFATV